MTTTTGDQVNVTFGADIRNLSQGMSTLTSQIQQTVGQMQNGFSNLGPLIETGLTNPVVLAAAAVAALAVAIDHGINKTIELSKEAFTLSSVMGITTEQASALKQALEEIGLSTDTYSQAFLKFVRQVKNNGSDLEANFGLKLRDANGHLRDGNVLFQEALAKVFQYKVGIDQDAVAMALFGKSVADVIKLHRLNNDATAEATKRNKELGLNITDNNIAAYQAWEKASNDAKDVLEAFWKVIGDAFIPILTELAQWFASIGPAAISVTRKAVGLLVFAFYTVQDSAVQIVAPIKAAMTSITSAAVNAAKAIGNVANLNFAAAGENLKQIGTDTSSAFKKSSDTIVGQLTKSQAAINEVLNPDQTTSSPKGGTKSAPNLEKGSGEKSDAFKLAEEEVKHTEVMQKEELEQKKAIAQSELNLGKITKQELIQQEIGFENDKYEIEREALQKRMEIAAQDPNANPAEKQKTLDQILELEKKHETEVLKLRLESAEEAEKYNIEAAKTIESSFQDLFQSVISGQKSLSDAFKDFINAIVTALSRLAAQNIAQFLLGGATPGSGGGLGGIISGLFGGGGSGDASSGFSGIIGGLFGGARAGGGDVQAGMSYLVGERGAEMFVPKTSGTIIPNNNLGTGKAVNVINNFTIQGNISQQSQQQMASMVGVSVNTALRRNN